VSIDELDSGLCLHIKAATFSGQYPLMKGLVDILERLGMKDKSPVLKYNQVYWIDCPYFKSNFNTWSCKQWRSQKFGLGVQLDYFDLKT